MLISKSSTSGVKVVTQATIPFHTLCYCSSSTAEFQHFITFFSAVKHLTMSGRRPVSTLSSGGGNGGPSNGHAHGGAARTQRTNRREAGKDSRRFHPNLITAQIVSFQCFQYLAQSILFQINALLYENSTVSVDRLFTDKYVHLWKSQGWPDCAAIFFAALIG